VHRDTCIGRIGCITAIAAALLMTLAASGLLAAPARAAPSMTLKLSPATILADGKSTATATAQVTKSNGSPARQDVVVFSSSSGQLVGPTTNHLDGTYTATITSTTTAGTAKIGAHDTTRAVSAQATLKQVSGPPAHIALRVSPHSILADGASHSTATASVADAFGNPVVGATIGFYSSDSGVHFSRVNDNGDGTYTATLTSSTTPGAATITATEPVTKVSGQATLTLATIASAASLLAVPSAAVTNQLVTLFAIVTATGSLSAPSGTITFEQNGTPIAGCINKPVLSRVDQQLSQSTCQVSFNASTSPEQLAAVFTSRSANIADSRATATVTVGRGQPVTSLDVSNSTVGIGANAMFAAHLTSINGGPVAPSGWVEFLDAGQPIAACAHRPLTVGVASSTATCRLTYKSAGSHSITARYGGDTNFTASASAPPQPITVHRLASQVRGTIQATMQWTFLSTAKFTKIRTFVVNQAPIGAAIAVTCHGRGCPFVKRVKKVRNVRSCRSTRTHKCRRQHPGTIDLRAGFQNRSLKVGTRIVVKITRPRWIGKHYLFTIRARRPPLVRIDCLAPGGSRPGRGC
jgi:adhesin/invasin